MAEKPTYQELEQRLSLLEKESERRKRLEEINTTLFKIANAINVTSNQNELFHSIHHALGAIIDTTNFYIALYDKNDDSITFPYVVDTVDIHYPPVIAVSKTGSLTAEVIRRRRPLLMTKAEQHLLQGKQLLPIPSCSPSEIWLGVPLQTRGEMIGVMAVQNYQDSNCYDETDLNVMVAVADQVALAIDRKRAEETLIGSEQRFRKVLQDIPSLAVQGYSPDGTTQYWNHASELLYGYTAREAIGRNLLELIIPPEIRQEVRQAMQWMAETGQAIPASELSLLRKDGSRVAVFSNHTIVQIPGKPQELFCIDIDISERKKAEEALRKSEQKLMGYAAQMEQFSLSAASMISIKDEKIIFAKISQAIVEFSDFRRVLISLFKDEHPYRELIGHGGVAEDLVEKLRHIPLPKSWYDHVFLQGQALGRFSYYIPHTMKHILNQEATVYGEGQPPEDDSAWHPEDNLFVRLNDENGEFIGVISVDDSKSGQKPCLETIRPLEIYAGLIAQIIILKREQARRERLEEQLRMAQKMESVGRLAGGVAHDFNNMLGVILGHAEMAEDQVDQTHPLYDDLQEIRKAAQRSAALTRQLLAFARKQTVMPKVLDLNETVAGMLTMLRRLIGEDIELIWRPGLELWQVKVDPSQIDQILANLCVNARDAIKGVGEIIVETTNVTITGENGDHHVGVIAGDYVRITLCDNGPGMQENVVAHIFEPFYTTKGVGEGTGLGLATVYGAIKQNNGFIFVDSEEGRGTTFTLYLPRHHHPAIKENKNLPPEPTPGGRECILLVEDEETILQMTATLLQHLGYRVLAANSPEEAFRLADSSTEKIHLLLTDVVMPQMNGREMAEKLVIKHAGMKCLFMSGYTADVISHHGVLDEGVYFMQKPFSKAELATKIRTALQEPL